MKPHFITSNQLAEQAGHQTAHSALCAMRTALNQADRLDILMDALTDVYSSSAGQEAALIGFAVGMLTTLERGLGVHK